MNNSAKYTFGFLSFILLIAGVITLMEQITGELEPSYLVPCGLIGFGVALGGFLLSFDGGSSGEACVFPDDALQDSSEGASATEEGGIAHD